MAAGGQPVGTGSRKLLEPLALQSGARASAGSQLALLARGRSRRLGCSTLRRREQNRPRQLAGHRRRSRLVEGPNEVARRSPPTSAERSLCGSRLWWTERARRSRGRWAWPYRATIGSDGIPASGTREATRAFEDLAVPHPDDEESERSPREKTVPPRDPPRRSVGPRAPRQGTESR